MKQMTYIQAQNYAHERDVIARINAAGTAVLFYTGDEAHKGTWLEIRRSVLRNGELDAQLENFREEGPWSEEEIAAWSEADLQAITCQDVASAIREMEVAEDYEDYQRLCEAGKCSGRLYKGDDGQWYFYLGT